MALLRSHRGNSQSIFIRFTQTLSQIGAILNALRQQNMTLYSMLGINYSSSFLAGLFKIAKL